MDMGLEKQMPGHIPGINGLGDIPIPRDFELRQSTVYPGLGLWTKVPLESGQKFGPFAGVFKSTMDDPSSAWELVDETGKVKGWIDAGDAGTGNWMKYVRSTESQPQRNIIAIQSGDQIFYQVACHILAGQEMVLSVNDGVYSERDLEHWPRSPRISTQEERELSCENCGEIFRSKSALIQHEIKHCDVRTTRFYLNPSRNRPHWREDSSRSPSPEASEPEHDSTWVKQEMIQDAVSGSPPEHHTSESSPTPTGSTSPPGADPLIEPYFRSESDSGLYKQFNCENCDKIFTDPSNLQRHIRSTHVGARCHACTDCGKTFATSSGLKQHQHIHSSVKPFQCEVCLRAYTQFSNLCRHKRMHADCRQQIKCKDCGQAFSTTTSLSKHKRFCEGVLRNGSRFGILPSPNKQTAPLAPNISQASAFSSPYMNMFAPRPAFPFFPPMGTGFPVFPSGHPMTAITPPMLHDGKYSTSISPTATTPYSSAVVGELERSTEMKKAGSEGSEGTDLSEVSTPASDLETSASDVDSDHGSEMKARQLLRPAHSGSTTSSPAVVSPYSTSSLLSFSSKSGPASSGPCDLSVRNINDSGVCDLSVKEKKHHDDSEQPFDLSKSAMKKVNSPDQPLDLSQKSITADTPRKTHIFGDVKQQESPEKKLHAAFPMANPFMLEQVMLMNREKLHSIQEEAARMLAMGPRFPMPASYGPMASLMTHSALDPSKSLSPLMKLENHSSVVPYSSSMSGKVKDRYSCRYCGKIFPRSANLTRHLRTHTGEQPYKCKYCERSFSISSNLQRHVRNIHNKEKPFKCPICDRCFGQQTNLDRHLKRHETEGPNIADSPSPQNEMEVDDAMSLHERETSYLHPGESDDSASDMAASPRKFEHLDANFSLTAQIEKQAKVDFDRGSDHEQLHDDERDEDDRDEIPAKIPRLENNNIAESAAILNRLPNGFRPVDMIPKSAGGVISCT